MFYERLPSEVNELIHFSMIAWVYAEGYVMLEVYTMTKIHINSIRNVQLVLQVVTLTHIYPYTSRRSPGDRIKITDARRLTTGIRSEKCVVRRFRPCANVMEFTYTNLDSISYYTPWLYGIAYCF
jgi:hypothetical protein